MYFDTDTDDERPATPNFSGESEEEAEEEPPTDAPNRYRALKKLTLLSEVYEELKSVVSPVQVVLVLGNMKANYARFPDHFQSDQMTRLKSDSNMCKTFAALGKLVIINPIDPRYVMHLKKSELRNIYSAVQACNGDIDAIKAAMQNMIEKDQIKVMKVQNTLGGGAAASSPSHEIIVNTFEKTMPVADFLLSTSTQNDALAFTLLVNDHDTLESSLDLIKMGVVQKDRAGNRGIFLDDMQKMLFNSNATKFVLVNLAGIVVEADVETELPPALAANEVCAEVCAPSCEKKESAEDKELTKQVGGGQEDTSTEASSADSEASSEAQVPTTEIGDASPSASPNASPNASPSASPNASPSASPNASPSASPNASPTASPSASPTASPAPSPPGSPRGQPPSRNESPEPTESIEGGSHPRAADRVPAQKTRRKGTALKGSKTTQRAGISVYT